MDWHAYYGSQLSTQLVGMNGATAVSNLEAGANVVRFRNIYFSRNWNDGKFILTFGQLAADYTFMVSEYAGLFMNASFGQFPAQAEILNAPAYPLSAPGIYFYTEPTGELFMRLGVYTANVGENDSQNRWVWLENLRRLRGSHLL